MWQWWGRTGRDHSSPDSWAYHSNQLYGKYKEIKAGYSSELFKAVLGYAVPQCVLGDDPVVPVLLQDVGLRAWQGGLPMAHVNSPAVYPILPPTTAPMHQCPHQAAVRGSSAVPTWSVPPGLARHAPVWPWAPPGDGLGAPGRACGGDSLAAGACAPVLELWGWWLVVRWPVDPAAAQLAARSLVCCAPSSSRCFYGM